MAVAFVALLAALSGTAVALPGKNRVKSDDIGKGQVKSSDLGKNAVTSAKTRNNSLTSADVKGIRGGDLAGNTVTGAQIDESSLGAVPTANTLNGSPAGAFQPASKQQRFGLIKMTVGQTDVPVGSYGPFRLRAECDAGPTAQMSLTTTESNTLVDSDEADDTDFDVGEDFVASSGDDEDDELNAASPSGTAITGQLYSTDQNPNLGGACVFWGEITTTSG